MPALDRHYLYNDANLQEYYRLEDETGKNGNNLTNANSVAFSAAKFGKGADFGSSDADKTLRTTNTLGYTGGAYSLMGWFKFNFIPTTDTLQNIMSVEEATTDTRLSVEYYNEGGTKKLLFSRVKINVAGQTATLIRDFDTTDFYHFALTYDGATVLGYVNGIQVGSVAASGSGAASTTAGFILAGQFNDLTANSGLHIADDVALFNRTLTAGEIRSVYNNGNDLNNYKFTTAQSGISVAEKIR